MLSFSFGKGEKKERREERKNSVSKREKLRLEKSDFRVTDRKRLVCEKRKTGCLFVLFLLVFVSERCREVLEKTKEK